MGWDSPRLPGMTTHVDWLFYINGDPGVCETVQRHDKALFLSIRGVGSRCPTASRPVVAPIHVPPPNFQSPTRCAARLARVTQAHPAVRVLFGFLPNALNIHLLWPRRRRQQQQIFSRLIGAWDVTTRRLRVTCCQHINVNVDIRPCAGIVFATMWRVD